MKIKLIAVAALAVLGALAVVLDPGAYAMLVVSPETFAGVMLANGAAAVDFNSVRDAVNGIKAQVDKFCAGQKEKGKEVYDKLGELQARMLEVEQRQVSGGGGVGGAPVGGGSHELRTLLEESAELQALAGRKIRNAVLELPKNLFMPQAAITSTGIVMPDQREGVVTTPQRRLRIRDLIPTVETDSGSVQYLEETGFTNNAAMVSEGDEKPQSELTYELKTVAVLTLAHFFKASNQVLSDISTMQQQIETRGIYGLALVEDSQLLNGSGLGNNLRGLRTAAQAYAGGGGTKIDIIRRAITQLEDADFNATGTVLNPADWEDMQLAKDADGNYIIGAPQGANPPTLWNRPVVVTSAIGSSTFLVGAFDQAALIYDRMQPRLDIGTTDDDFVRNLIVLRFESRLAQAVIRPSALIKGSFGS